MNRSLSTSLDPQLFLEVTVVSAKHLKNVNWRIGELEPHAVLYLDTNYRVYTQSDRTGSTKPVWNESFTLPLTRSVHESVLYVQIFHSKLSDTPKPLVGSAQVTVAHLVKEHPGVCQSVPVILPSGRQQGKIRLKIGIKERRLPPPPPSMTSAYYHLPRNSYFYPSVTPPPRHMTASPSPPTYFDHYNSGFYYHQPPPLPSITMQNPASNYAPPRAPSAPIDSSPSDNHKPPHTTTSPFPSTYSDPFHSGFYYNLPPVQLPISVHHGLPRGPSAPVDSSPSDDHNQRPPPPPVKTFNVEVSRGTYNPPMSNYCTPSGPSAPTDSSPSEDHNQPPAPVKIFNFSLPSDTYNQQPSNYVQPRGISSALADLSPSDDHTRARTFNFLATSSTYNPSLSNYSLPYGLSSAPVDSSPSDDHKPPLPTKTFNYLSPNGTYSPSQFNYSLTDGPSAPVDASLLVDHKPLTPPLFHLGSPSGPSAPVDYSPYDQGQLQRRVGELSLEEEKESVDRGESESHSYYGDQRCYY